MLLLNRPTPPNQASSYERLTLKTMVIDDIRKKNIFLRSERSALSTGKRY